MPFLKPFAFLLAGLAAGAALAFVSLALGAPAGWIGALALVGWALWARRQWARLEATTGLEPGAPERVLWLRLAGTSLVLGQVTASILLVGDGLRLGSGNSLALDSWTIALGHLIASLLFRADLKALDERHAPIAAQGVRVGYVTLIVVILPLLVWMVVMPLALRSLLTHFTLANVFIALMLVSYAAMLLAQIAAYAKDTRDAAAAEASLR